MKDSENQATKQSGDIGEKRDREDDAIDEDEAQPDKYFATERGVGEDDEVLATKKTDDTKRRIGGVEYSDEKFLITIEIATFKQELSNFL